MDCFPHLHYLIQYLERVQGEEKQDGGNVNGTTEQVQVPYLSNLNYPEFEEKDWYSACLQDFAEAASSNENLFYTLYLNLHNGEASGIVHLDTNHFHTYALRDELLVLYCNWESKNMKILLVSRSGDVSMIGDGDFQHNQIIDLNMAGRRWEGDTIGGDPCGYGILYDDAGEKEYEGFLYQGECVGYGKDYYANLRKLRYEGGFYNGMYCGQGIRFDRKGGVDWEGIWHENSPCKWSSSLFSYPFLSCQVEYLNIANGSGNRGAGESIFLTSALARLKEIHVGEKCFRRIRQLHCIGLKCLEKIVIGAKSFDRDVNLSSSSSNTTVKEFVVRDCPQLLSLKVEASSFVHYNEYIVEQVDRLTSLIIEENCFLHLHTFSLASTFISCIEIRTRSSLSHSIGYRK